MSVNFRIIKIILVTTIFFIIILLSVIFLSKKMNISFIKIEDKKFNYISGNFKTTLEKELVDNKIDRKDIDNIIKAYSKKLDFRKLAEKDDYLITLSSTNQFISMIIDKGESSYTVYKTTSGMIFEKALNSIKISTYSVEGTIKSILWTSMSEKKVPDDVILNFADIFAWQIDFLTDVRDNDKFKVVYILKENGKGKVIEKKVLLGVYEGSEVGRNIMVYFNEEYYNEKGEGAKSMFLKAPLQYRRISSYFSYRRFHPVLKYVRPHLGIDYAAPTGTPVSSVADGVVIYKGWKGGYGNYVEIKHSMGYVTSYGHLSRYAKNIYGGKRVKQGDVIGYVGATGIATGPHLDFRVKQNGKFLNFLKMRRTSNINLDKKYIPELNKKIEELMSI